MASTEISQTDSRIVAALVTDALLPALAALSDDYPLAAMGLPGRLRIEFESESVAGDVVFRGGTVHTESAGGWADAVVRMHSSEAILDSLRKSRAPRKVPFDLSKSIQRMDMIWRFLGLPLNALAATYSPFTRPSMKGRIALSRAMIEAAMRAAGVAARHDPASLEALHGFNGETLTVRIGNISCGSIAFLPECVAYSPDPASSATCTLRFREPDMPFLIATKKLNPAEEYQSGRISITGESVLVVAWAHLLHRCTDSLKYAPWREGALYSDKIKR